MSEEDASAENRKERWSQFSRRDFLLASGQTVVGVLASPWPVFAESAQPRTTQTGKSGYQYAAGESVLPFSYVAKESPAPEPDGLNFSHQVNPDNCQIFVRIDDELWEFRSQWVINLGTVARYKGPDIDHLVRVEDGLYPDGMTSCWFLGGMWYDDSGKKLYAAMHIEADGPRRAYPFSRKIALATSVDKGRTWSYEGDIVTSETYYYTYDFAKFSGSSYGIGVADFGFYVDERGGYFYIFPDEGWAPWETRGMRWNSRAARCAIADKMAPGKWNYFYDGAWAEPALGGKSSIIAPSHFWGITYSTVLNQYLCVFTANQDPPTEPNIDGIYIGSCTDLSKQDWVWGHCPEARFGFLNLINVDGTDIARVCDSSFRLYTYFGEGSFQRLDFTLSRGHTTLVDLQHRMLFDPHPESSEPLLGRKTKIVGSQSAEMKYAGEWQELDRQNSYLGKARESSTPASSVEFSFTGADIYWRALHSPAGGKANVYIDGTLCKEVDCYSPRSTSWEQFLFIKQGLDPFTRHTIKVVVTGKKHPKSSSAAIEHIAFEFSAESYRASAGFSGLMGKNQWFYQRRKGTEWADLVFTVDEDHPIRYWWSDDGCRIGGDFLVPGVSSAVRTWKAPHGGTVRIEGHAVSQSAIETRIDRNGEVVLSAGSTPDDFELTVIQGDAISFVASHRGDPAQAGEPKVFWDPVITYKESIPAVWLPNDAGDQDLARNKSARSKVLVSHYRPFDAVDGNLNTSFTIHADDKLSHGDDWLQVDLEQPYRIDHYVVCSQTADSEYRVTSFTLQRSDDDRHWTDVETVHEPDGPLEHYYGIPMSRIARSVPVFTARFVRIYFPKGKPFTLTALQLYYTEGKTSFKPPIPAG